MRGKRRRRSTNYLGGLTRRNPALAPGRARRVLDRFVRSFDGGSASGFVRADVRPDERIAGVGLDADGRVRFSADRTGPNPYRFFADDADEESHLHAHLANQFARLFPSARGYDAPIFDDVDEGRIPSLVVSLASKPSGVGVGFFASPGIASTSCSTS